MQSLSTFHTAYENNLMHTLWITSKDQLDLPVADNEIQFTYNHSFYGSSSNPDTHIVSFMIAQREVYDLTCNKSVKLCISANKADETICKKKATKKHSKCEFEIRDVLFADEIEYGFENLWGTSANNSLWMSYHIAKKYYNFQLGSFITRTSNITINARVVEIITDRFILTANNKQMRLTKYLCEDFRGQQETVTLFDFSDADKVEVGKTILKLDKISMSHKDPKKYQMSFTIPKWGSVAITDSLTSGKIQYESPLNYIMDGVFNHDSNLLVKEEPKPESQVICEQPYCAGVGKDRQFFCMNCDLQICSVCRFEHMKNTSVTNKNCDENGMILFGTRGENQC